MLNELDALEFCANEGAAPSSPGAYILEIYLAEPLSVAIARQPPTTLPAGGTSIAVQRMVPEGSSRAWRGI